MAAASNPAAALQLLLEFQQVQAQRAEAYSRFSDGFRRFLDSPGQERALTALMQQTTPAFAAASKQVIQIESCLRSPAVGRPDLAGLLRQVQELERNKLQLTLSWQALRAAHAAGRFSWQSEADRPRTGGSVGERTQQQQQQQQQQLVGLLEQLQVAQQADASAVSDQQQQVDGCMTVKPGFYQQQLQQAAAAAEAAEAAAASSSSSSANGHGHCCGGGRHHHEHSHEPPHPLDSSPLEPSEAEYNAAVREALQELDACVTRINETLEEVRDAVQELQDEGPNKMT